MEPAAKPAAVPPPKGSPPPFAGEMVMKRQGGTAVKVWGILLLIGALFSAVNVGGSITIALSGGFDLKSMPTMPGMDPELLDEMNVLTKKLIASELASFSFWANLAASSVVTVICFAASIQLLRSRPSGRVLALVLGALLLLSVPLTGYEMLNQINSVMPAYEEMMRNTMKRQMDKASAKYEREASTMTEAEKTAAAERKAARQREVEEIMGQMSGIMKISGAVSVVLTVLITLVIDLLLLFSMTRPKTREYLENAAKYKDSLVPGFHPALGLPLYAPPVATEASDFAKAPSDKLSGKPE
ncbi:MAG: hypothetical protein IT462_16855 [Planctomycetes bacterium]|nr:hypothetical protein [Planctomycetota bacterium]